MSITKTVFKIGDFVSWAKSNQLNLSPKFQRRPVWKKGAKSYLLDTVIRGLPIPIVFLRDRLTLDSVVSKREVVDGQQRLRTLLSYIDPKLVQDFDPDIDQFTLTRAHDSELAGKNFGQLPKEARLAIIGYEVPVHVFSSDTEDRDVLQIFARLNSTGVKLNHQELRNANYYGEFKTLCYSLAYKHLSRWEKWGIHDDADISRMREADECSDLIISMHEGVHGKQQKKIDKYYGDFDESYPKARIVGRRFDSVMDAIDESAGDVLEFSEFSRLSLFHSLFLATYEMLYGLGSQLTSSRPGVLPAGFGKKIVRLSAKLSSGDVPEDVARSMRGATSDLTSRRERLNFILEAFGRAVD